MVSTRSGLNTTTNHLTGANAASPLLQLPPELRNKIYEFVLTAPTGIRYEFRNRYTNDPKHKMIKKDTFLCANEPKRYPQEHHELNNLKYVCRQLFFETSALELKLNPLTFERQSEILPDECFLGFAQACMPSKLSWLKTVILTKYPRGTPPLYLFSYFLQPEDFDAYIRVSNFCKDHPSITVKYILQSWSYAQCYQLGWTARGFIQQGIVLNRALRNKDLGFLVGGGDEAAVLETWTGRCSRDWRKWQAENLRFCTGEEAFDEAEYRRLVEKRNQGYVERWVEYAREWVENGI